MRNAQKYNVDPARIAVMGMYRGNFLKTLLLSTFCRKKISDRTGHNVALLLASDSAGGTMAAALALKMREITSVPSPKIQVSSCAANLLTQTQFFFLQILCVYFTPTLKGRQDPCACHKGKKTLPRIF